MSDLVERLRDPVLVKAGMSLHREAADEIEHLRAVLKLRKLADAEIERLQVVLDACLLSNKEYEQANNELTAKIAELQTRNNALYEAIDILKRGGKLK